jgi:REP element-mobilizing transposase RayT
MPRKKIAISSEHPYHITARCINREWFNLPLDRVWPIMSDFLFLVSAEYSMKIHSFVLMPNHFHLLAHFPKANPGSAMNYFMRETSREITRISGRINQTYGARYHKSLISNHHYFMNAYKYVYRNPVRAELCTRTQEYPFSSLAGLCGQSHLAFPVEEDNLLFAPTFQDSTLNWLNQTPNVEEENDIRRALRHSQFELGVSKETGQSNRLESHLY